MKDVTFAVHSLNRDLSSIHDVDALLHRVEEGAVEGIEAGDLLCILRDLTDAGGLLILADAVEP